MSGEYLVLMRLAQLMLGSVIGLLCIYFGYRLFAQIPVNVTNDGQFKMPNVGEAKLKVAPGIFFAILGTAIVYFSLDRSISIRYAPSVDNPGSPSASLQGPQANAPTVQVDAKTSSSNEDKSKSVPPATLPSAKTAQPGFEYSQTRGGGGLSYDCQSPTEAGCRSK